MHLQILEILYHILFTINLHTKETQKSHHFNTKTHPDPMTFESLKTEKILPFFFVKKKQIEKISPLFQKT